jgi:hypothetical protein
MRSSFVSFCVLPAILLAVFLGGCGSRQSGSLYSAAPPPSAKASAPPMVALAGGSRGFNVKPLAFKPADYGKKH